MQEIKNWLVPIKCPYCSENFKFKFGEFRKGNIIKCPNCDASFHFESDAYNKIERSIRKLQETARKLK